MLHTYPAQALQKRYDEDGCPVLGFPLGWDIKKLYGEDMHNIDYVWMPYPTNINPKDIVEVKFSPQNGDLYGIFVYKIPENTPLAIHSSRDIQRIILPT
ncbi:MAG: hypothetical protein PUP93_21030 [Rhizonema sp. NSF051]|nr:hypothetical protein [Rhizonema sp. NSF051]